MNVLRRPFRYSFNQAVFFIIGINVLVFIVTYLLRITQIAVVAALTPALTMYGYPPLEFPWFWQIFTYMFIHRGWQHIIFNMLGLFIFGYQVERRMGTKEFILYYFVTGGLAGLFSLIVYVFTGQYFTTLLGASGAIFAVELAYAAFFPDSLVYIWGILPLRAPVMVLGYTALEVFLSFRGLNSGVAHLTHLFGFAAGWLYFLVRFGINPWKAFWGR